MDPDVNKVLGDDARVVMITPGQEEERKPVEFWYRHKSRLRINCRLFVDFLNQLGFRLYFTGSDYFFVRIENNIVEEISIAGMKETVKNYILDPETVFEEGVTAEEILELVISQSHFLFSRNSLEYLEPLEDNFREDTRTESFIWFKNCFVSVTASGHSIHPYGELDKPIWKNQIIEHEFNKTDEVSDFQSFIFKAAGTEAERYDSFRSVIGYLLHTYKDPALAKAIIFMDEKLDDGSNGGCGKSLLGNAISKVRKSLRLGGKNFWFERFAFQSYEPGTSIIEFNDLSKTFRFENLFTAITDNISVEKKNRDEVIIPFEHSPKILLSTNYTIKGVDESTLRRQFVLEFSDYFSIRYSPEDEFGHRFFDDWCENDWCSFYRFMIGCLSFYLQKGLVDYTRINLDIKKMIESTSEEFLEFAEDLALDTWYDKRETYRKFIEDYPDFNNSKMEQRKFTNWLKDFARIKGLKFLQRKSGADRAFSFESLSSLEAQGGLI